MSKINDIANATAENGWTYEPGINDEVAFWTRPASDDRTEKVEVHLTANGRVHHAWYSIGTNEGHNSTTRFSASEVVDLIDLITDPAH